MLNQLFAIKPVDANAFANSGLKRVLGARQLFLLGIGAIIGAGIFVMTGTAAANYAGPGVMLSFVMAGLACAFAGLCYAEFAAMMPVSGSAYSYTYSTMGEVVAWFIGWNLVLEYLFAASTVAVGWSGYLNSFLSTFGMAFPDALSQAPYTFVAETKSFVSTGATLNLPAVMIVAAISALCYRGITQSAWVNALIVFIKVTVIVLFLGFAFQFINPENWNACAAVAKSSGLLSAELAAKLVAACATDPSALAMIPPTVETAGHAQYGMDGVIRGAAVVFFAYIGFDAVSTAAGEAKNPQRDMPIGILGSLVFCTILYIAMAATMTGLLPFTELGTSKPVATAMEAYPQLAWLKHVVEIGAIAGLSSVILVMLMGQPRIFYAMAQDGLLPKAFEKVHPTYGTPYVGTIIVGIVAALMAGFLPLGFLGDLVSMGTLLAFATVSAGVLILRYTRPELARPFRVWGVWLVVPIAVVSCLYLFIQPFADHWQVMTGWTVLGFLIYFFYGYRNSKLRKA
ncbi:amino acid permease [Silanimonas sp.]|jgi:APA family basic amino acid/polyamine antiporter|uniref:amino acid permease n=1 Tax=Silanimonas sp. TaxID=1929290 RepID=UPI0022C8A42F|nr:amino acid permease [Silanimonas sp.]MCZ8166266.1 amino acid permease [Silanimonas sp.]